MIQINWDIQEKIQLFQRIPFISEACSHTSFCCTRLVEPPPEGLMVSSSMTGRQWLLEKKYPQPSYTEEATSEHCRLLSSEASFHFLLCDPLLQHPQFKPINSFNWLSPSPPLHLLRSVCASDCSVNTQMQVIDWLRKLTWVGGRRRKKHVTDMFSYWKLPRTIYWLQTIGNSGFDGFLANRRLSASSKPVIFRHFNPGAYYVTI